MRRHIRLIALPFLIYIAVDFVDPLIPGVFCFDSNNLFVDGVMQTSPAEAVGTGAPKMEPRELDSIVPPVLPHSSRVEMQPSPVVRARGRAHTRLARDGPSPPSSASEDH